MTVFIKKILFPFLIILSFFLIILQVISRNEPINNNYVLKAYKNTVALYNGAEIIKTYNNIVLNTLPENDIYQFSQGITVTSPEHAERYLEDFDS